MFKIENVSKSYGRQNVLVNVSLTVNDGEAVCIAGPNGCGKSTLLKIAAGVMKPDSGSVGIVGERTALGYVPQEPPLIEELSVRDNLRFWYCTGGANVEKMCGQPPVATLEILPFIDKKVSCLSGGMKKRVSIACACGGNPAILVMDEPGASLDAEFKRKLREFIAEFTGNGGIVLFSSHEDAEIAMADRIVRLEKNA
jgi:ABC-2 type transport system ATP-binding protein